MIPTVAYIPFITPLPIYNWWYLLLPVLALGISMIWKALRMKTTREFWPQVALMTVQIVAAMIALSIFLIIFITLIIPRLPAE